MNHIFTKFSSKTLWNSYKLGLEAEVHARAALSKPIIQLAVPSTLCYSPAQILSFSCSLQHNCCQLFLSLGNPESTTGNKFERHFTGILLQNAVRKTQPALQNAWGLLVKNNKMWNWKPTLSCSIECSPVSAQHCNTLYFLTTLCLFLG